jgi:hypothetical protein
MTAVGQTRKSVTVAKTSAFGIKAEVDFGRLDFRIYHFRTLRFEARGQAFRVIWLSVINSETPIVFITMALDR